MTGFEKSKIEADPSRVMELDLERVVRENSSSMLIGRRGSEARWGQGIFQPTQLLKQVE